MARREPRAAPGLPRARGTVSDDDRLEQLPPADRADPRTRAHRSRGACERGRMAPGGLAGAIHDRRSLRHVRRAVQARGDARGERDDRLRRRRLLRPLRGAARRPHLRPGRPRPVSRRAGRRVRGIRGSASGRRRARMTLLRLPEPYDFELSTERFRAFGPDLANLWHAGGVQRVVGTREIRIERAPGGVDVEPRDEEVEPVARAVVGAEFDLAPFYEWTEGDEVLRVLVPKLAGFRPPLAPDPYETIVSAISAQQVSLFAAFAIRNRMVERFGLRGVHAYAFPTTERMARADEDELT